MPIEVERDSPTCHLMTNDAYETVIESMRDFARRLYRQLPQEYEHLTSANAVDQTLAANCCIFTARSERFG